MCVVVVVLVLILVVFHDWKVDLSSVILSIVERQRREAGFLVYTSNLKRSNFES